eukprot:6545318-Lingulodinium_polyedra.AAC.1
MRSRRCFVIAADRKPRVCAPRAWAENRPAGPRVERPSVRFASSCDGEASIRPRFCAAFAKR